MRNRLVRYLKVDQEFIKEQWLKKLVKRPPQRDRDDEDLAKAKNRLRKYEL